MIRTQASFLLKTNNGQTELGYRLEENHGFLVNGRASCCVSGLFDKLEGVLSAIVPEGVPFPMRPESRKPLLDN